MPAPITHAISWEQFHQDARRLAALLIERKNAFSKIIAITKGGMVPAMIIARELGISDIRVIGARSYGLGGLEEEKKRGRVVIDRWPSYEDLSGFPLIVDDLVDSCATLNAVHRVITDLSVKVTPRPLVHYAVLYTKGVMPKTPNFHFAAQYHPDTWLLMPWDMAPQFQLPLSCKSNTNKNAE